MEMDKEIVMNNLGALTVVVEWNDGHYNKNDYS
jgi:hypothetical protein